MNEKSEARVERGPVAQDAPFALGMAKLLEREGKTVAAAELRRLHAPPQRKPLTEEEATALVQSVVSNSDRPIGMVAYGLLVVGAVERAHGIGDNT